MPVNRVRRSLAAQRVAEQAILAMLAQQSDIANMVREPGMLEMIPIYSMSAKNVANKRWNRGWRSGWRYFWTHPNLDFGMIVEIRRNGTGGPTLASTSLGKAASALQKQLFLATKEIANETNRYRPRILRLPWISMEALWFNSDQTGVSDVFIDRSAETCGKSFEQEVTARAQSFLNRYENAKRASLSTIG